MNYFIETLNENKKQLEPHLHHQCRRSSEFSNLLIPLLTALNWKMAPHEFLNALPYHSDVIEELELRNTLARLNFKSNIIHKPLEQISPRFIPYIYIPQGSSALLVLEH